MTFEVGKCYYDAIGRKWRICQEIRMCPCDNVVDAVRQIKAWGAL